MSLNLKANCYGLGNGCHKFIFFCGVPQAYKGWVTLS